MGEAAGRDGVGCPLVCKIGFLIQYVKFHCHYVDAGGVAVNGQLMWSLMACRGQTQTVGDGPLPDPGCGALSPSDFAICPW